MKTVVLYILIMIIYMSSCSGFLNRKPVFDLSTIDDAKSYHILQHELDKYVLTPVTLAEHHIIFQNGLYIYEGDIVLNENQVKLLCYKNIIEELFGKKNYSYALYLLAKKNRTWSVSEKNNLSYSFIDEMDMGGLSDAEVKDCFRKALQTWMSVADIRFFEHKNEGRIKIEICYQSRPFGQHSEATSGYSAYPHQHDTTKQLIILNKYYWDELSYINSDREYMKKRLVQAMLHFIGHSLGLAHYHRPYTQNNIIYPVSYSDSETFRPSSIMDYSEPDWDLSPRDITIIQHLYGKPKTSKEDVAKR